MEYWVAFLLLAAQPVFAPHWVEMRRILTASRIDLAERFAANGSLTIEERQKGMNQMSNAATLWSSCVRMIIEPKAKSSLDAGALVNIGMRRCTGDLEQYRKWVQMMAQVSGAAATDPRIDTMISATVSGTRRSAVDLINRERSRAH